MIQPQFLSATEARRGVILMVVLILLTLFAIVGLSFALYAGAEAGASQLYREAEVQLQPDADPEMLLSYFLGQLILDADDSNGVYSALRGHSLARNMYGYNHPLGFSNDVPSDNNVPWNGVGRLHVEVSGPTSPFPGTVLDEYNLINYMRFLDRNGNPVDQGFVHDPERKSWRKLANQPGNFAGGFNVSYTYPDLNNMFLAAVKAGPVTDASGNILAPPGAVLMPSFHRPWLFTSLTDVSGNQNWTNAEGKYKTLRPRPVDMGPGFPYPEDEGGDVKNLVGSPGYYDALFTKKLCNNDSIWMDLGFPVMVAPNGRKFKPLFAPLINDLDNRVNVNIHGNIHPIDAPGAHRSHTYQHRSNQGWGPWEVNLNRVLTKTDEWTKLFVGTLPFSQPLQLGRYGYTPDSPLGNTAKWNWNQLAGTEILPPFYSWIDFDAADYSNHNMPTKPFTLPMAGGPFTCFPTYTQGFGNASPDERRNHPLLYNAFQPNFGPALDRDDRVFPLSDMEALLRYSDTGSLALTSDLFRLLPHNLDPTLNPDAAKVRQLLTTHSFDLDRPGVRPWIWPDPKNADYSYNLPDSGSGTLFPIGKPIPFTQTANPVGDEFGRDGRANDAIWGRIDLNRTLPPYPTVLPSNAVPFDLTNPTIKAQFDAAQSARQQLAKDIYQRFQLVTTGTVAHPDPPTGTSPPQVISHFRAMRWLAQLAVNIVDYIDSDDYMTPFNWYTKDYTDQNGRRHPNGDWVFGTELPRLVINEAYAELANDPSDPLPTDAGQKHASKDYHMNFWVELHNPMMPDSALTENGKARLQLGAGAVYQLVIAIPSPGDRDPDNVLGDILPMGRIKTAVREFAPPTGSIPATRRYDVVEPTDGSYDQQETIDNSTKNQKGFYVLGPVDDFPGGGSQFATLRVKEQVFDGIPSRMNYTIPLGPVALPTHNLYLRRLACPYLPPQLKAELPYYNPYITVDYMENVPANDAIKYDKTQDRTDRGFVPVVGRYSQGRLQPYAGHLSQQVNYKPDTDPAKDHSPIDPNKNNGQPQHTFFRHNGREKDPTKLQKSTPNQTMQIPFQWLQHADRPLISPMELLHVSAFKPHELTQQFRTQKPGLLSRPIDYNHRAASAFLDQGARDPSGRLVQSSRLYRVFEFLETHNRAAGTAAGGRLPGRININTIWDLEVFLALCDPQLPNVNSFDDPKVTELFNKTISSDPKNPNPAARTPRGTPSKDDRPFLSMATGSSAQETQYPKGIGIEDTFLRLLVSTPQNPMLHPSQQCELMTKIFNNVTTRSNVFAVWVTVGFFEVVGDESVRPVKLGAEIGKAENRNIRHRMFAIVDRTNLSTLANVAFLGDKGISLPPNAIPVPKDVPVDKLNGITPAPYSILWSIRKGSSCTIDVGANQETVIILDVTPPDRPPMIRARFTKSHVGGAPISLNDTPGPPPVFLSADQIVPVDPRNPNLVKVYVSQLHGTYEGVAWAINQGDLLVVDTGAKVINTGTNVVDPQQREEEIVTVGNVDQGNPLAIPPVLPSFQTQFQKFHAAPLTIQPVPGAIEPVSRAPSSAYGKPGNPGPQPRFNPRDPVAAQIVRYFSIIE